MHTEINTNPNSCATQYQHKFMTERAFDKLVDRFHDGGEARRLTVWSDFYALEYLNTPCGVIVFAFHDLHDLETFYPTSFDFKERTGLTTWADEITHATDVENPNFMRHSMGRKISYFVAKGAFGEIVSQDDPRVTLMEREFSQLDVFDSPKGLIVAAHEGRYRYVIYPVEIDQLPFHNNMKVVA